jgi:hypothetical protein
LRWLDGQIMAKWSNYKERGVPHAQYKRRNSD